MVAVDDVLLEGKFVKEVVGVLATGGLVALQHLAGTPKSLIEKLSVAAGGLLGRSFQTADEVSTAKRLKASKKGAPGTNQVASQGLQVLLGREASAGAVARAIIAGFEIVDVESKLKTVALDSLPVCLRAQPALYHLLEADDKAAKDASPQHVCRPYPQGSVTIVDELRSGGRTYTLRQGELEWDPNADMTTKVLQ